MAGPTALVSVTPSMTIRGRSALIFTPRNPCEVIVRYSVGHRAAGWLLVRAPVIDSSAHEYCNQGTRNPEGRARGYVGHPLGWMLTTSPRTVEGPIRCTIESPPFLSRLLASAMYDRPLPFAFRVSVPNPAVGTEDRVLSYEYTSLAARSRRTRADTFRRQG